MSRTFSRRTAIGGAAGAALGLAALPLAGCTADGTASETDTDVPSATGPPPRHEVVLAADARVARLGSTTEPSVAAARALLARCTAVVVAPPGEEPTTAGARVATSLGLPLLVAGPGLTAELDRLDVRTVVRVPVESPAATASAAPWDVGEREVVDVTGPDVPDVDGLPPRGPDGDVLVVLAPGADVPAVVEPLLALCGADRTTLRHTDPRRDGAAATTLRGAAGAAVLGIGDLGEHFAQRVRTVRHAAELPGGGWLPFADRRMVALYGHPQTTDLGLLGEQGPAASVRRARAYARQFATATGDEVVPAFELIATVASGSAGADGSYSRRTALGVLEPWVAAAADAGVYVVLDLQPGRSDFLDQAKAYESLLRQPHVGLALDPEWRLGPTEKPLQRIGHVGIAEVNRVGRWLAALVREHDLPPKVLTLHEFRTSMVRDRERLDTGLDEVQWVVHADGQGSQAQKQGTWAALRRDLPDGVHLGWKNFEDEDRPVLTPRRTAELVSPTPSFVSYQ